MRSAGIKILFNFFCSFVDMNCFVNFLLILLQHSRKKRIRETRTCDSVSYPELERPPLSIIHTCNRLGFVSLKTVCSLEYYQVFTWRAFFPSWDSSYALLLPGLDTGEVSSHIIFSFISVQSAGKWDHLLEDASIDLYHLPWMNLKD